MKKQLRTFFILLALSMAGFSQNWQWALNVTGGLDEASESIARDAAGNIYVSGWFRSGQLTLDTITINNAFGGTGDVFVAKFTASGNVIWAQRFGKLQEDVCMGIAVTPAGDVYITGNFLSPSILFGNDTLVNPSSNKNEFFVAKLNTQGVPQWARKGSGSDHDYGKAVAVMPDGGVVVTGDFYSMPLTVGTYTLTNTNINYRDAFVARYDAQGNLLWARQSTGNSYEEGNAVACDANGNTYIGGTFGSNPMTVGTFTIANPGFSGAFLVKYDSLGTVQWAKGTTGNNSDEGHGVTTDQLGNVYLAGAYKSTNFSVGTFTLSNSGQQDVFICKFDSQGTGLWAQKATGTSFDRAYEVTTDSSNNCYITGYFASNALYFGSYFIVNNSSGTGDIFVAKYGPQGSFMWATAGGGNDYDYGKGIVVTNGNVVICGSYDSYMMTLGTSTLTAITGYYEGFIAGMGNSTTGLGNQPRSATQLRLAPNPAASAFKVQAIAGARIEIVNVLGETVYADVLPASETQISLNVPPGLYFVRLLEGNQVLATERLLLTH